MSQRQWNSKRVNETLPKEIVAFLNTDGGSIYIGVKDDGSTIGVFKVNENLKKISDIITDNIEPIPAGLVDPKIEFIDDKIVIVINVKSSVGMAGNFSFNTLKNYYTSAGYHLNDNSFEQSLKLRTLDGHYNKMAELLSDSNMIPVIVSKYGQEAFEITDNYINVTIPFDEDVMVVGGNPVGNSELENYVISNVLENNKISANAIPK